MNDINLKDTTGFNYLNDYSLLCHLQNEKLNKNLEYLQEYSTKNKLIYLPEDNVIFINNIEGRIIGTSKHAILKSRKYEFHTSENLPNDMF